MTAARKIYLFGFLLLIMILCCSCSTRGINDKYFGATEQRLITQSVDKLINMLPEKDFAPLKGRAIFLECHFIEENASLKYAKKRFELELIEKYKVDLASDPASADKIIYVFFNAIGTEQDDFGLKTPEFIIPGMNSTMGVDIITLDMYHGVSELYYYIVDQKNMAVVRGEKIRSIIRTDKLNLPIISIPVNTLD